MARRILAWECQYCGALKKTQNIAIRHEKTCLKNPKSKNCLLCEHAYFDSEKDKKMCKVNGKQCNRAISSECDDFKLKFGG